MDLKGKRILVTGASGFIGSWLVQALLAEHAEPIAIVRDDVPGSMYLQEMCGKAVTLWGNLENYGLVERAINEYETEYILHLAAQTIVKIANHSPLSTFESNIKGTWNVLEASRQNDKVVKGIALASSDKAYGEHDVLPYTEDAPLKPNNPYDASKAAADLLAIAYAHTYAMQIGISRCGNVFGGGDLNFSRIVPVTIRSLLHNERPVIRSDGTYVRDYLYVEDVVQGYLQLLGKTVTSKFHGDVYNFSYQKPLTVLEIVETISKHMGKTNLKPMVKNEVSNEIKKQHLNSSKARKILQWSPQYNLEKGLKKTIEWYARYFVGDQND